MLNALFLLFLIIIGILLLPFFFKVLYFIWMGIVFVLLAIFAAIGRGVLGVFRFIVGIFKR